MGARPRVARHGLRPVVNPTRDVLRFTATLRRAGPAVLELFDLGGRRLARRELDGAGPGTLELSIPEPVGRSGVILARLTQGGESCVARVIRIR